MGNIALTDVIPQDSLERQLYFIEKCKAYVADLQEKLGRPLTCCTQTFGCQMNARDSEKLLGILTEIGYVPVETEEADLVLYNTCTVRENANLRVYGRLGHLNGLKKKNPHMIIALCGCMMQETQVVEKIKQSYRFVDIMFGTFNIFKLAELLYSRWTQEDQIIDIWDSTKEVVEELPTMRKYPFKSGVNIMYGCNNFCSYCIVPYVRGREKSREPKEIIMEIERLVKDGVKEVMLLGQNVNSYGKNLSVPVTFAELLQEVEKIDGLERIRFMTPHPKDLSDDLIDVMSKSKKICNHVHLPVQSGSSRLLKLMNRNYTKEHYLELVDKIRSKMPDVSLTTDIIVGFPGETEEDHQINLDFVNEMEFERLGVFTYSAEENTPAANMPNQIDEEVKEDRRNDIMELQQDIVFDNSEKHIGKTYIAMIEGRISGENAYMGRTYMDVPGIDSNIFIITDEELMTGDFVKVKVTGINDYDLIGQLDE